ncbi:MAG: hypothetical protein MR750_04435, partial [Methanobrevibacter boviskoreani]
MDKDRDIVVADRDMNNKGIDVDDDVSKGTNSINDDDLVSADGDVDNGASGINDNDTVNMDGTDDDVIYQIANNEILSLNNANKTDDLAITVYNGNNGLVTEKQHERIPTVYVVSKSNIAIDNIKKTVNSEHYIFL